MLFFFSPISNFEEKYIIWEWNRSFWLQPASQWMFEAFKQNNNNKKKHRNFSAQDFEEENRLFPFKFCVFILFYSFIYRIYQWNQIAKRIAIGEIPIDMLWPSVVNITNKLQIETIYNQTHTRIKCKYKWFMHDCSK